LQITAGSGGGNDNNLAHRDARIARRSSSSSGPSANGPEERPNVLIEPIDRFEVEHMTDSRQNDER
jgi:hypothetical protein